MNYNAAADIGDRPALRPTRHRVVRDRQTSACRAIAIASIALALFTIAYFAAEMLRVTL